MSKKYKFRLNEQAFLEFNKENLDSFQDVKYTDDNSKGKIIPVKRDFDGKVYKIIVPLDLIEECE